MAKINPSNLLNQLSSKPGVYQMLGESGRPLYVGKASNLRKRVSSYFQKGGHNTRIMTMINRVCDIDVTVTASETEALLLEQNLIKEHRPSYNILLKDDKSFPYISLSNDKFPRLFLYRGGRRKGEKYFGPYPGASAVRDSLNFLYSTFGLRQCENSMFKNRSRPCLQYQIKRCSAPCVNFIDEKEYAANIKDAVRFLEGDNQNLIEDIRGRMEKAAKNLEYEHAGVLRDKLIALNRVRETQCIEGESGNMDIIAIAARGKASCVHILFVRAGRILGSRSHFPRTLLAVGPREVLHAFIGSFYLTGVAEIPQRIITNHPLPDKNMLACALEKKCGHKVVLSENVRDDCFRRLQICLQTAEQNLSMHLAGKRDIDEQYAELAHFLELEQVPERMECFDISHQMGREPTASCVVFDQFGEKKSDYRRFKITNVTAGDDYAALYQALERRYSRILKEGGVFPDVVFVDGGEKQLSQALSVWQALGLPAEVRLFAIVKNEKRESGKERILGPGGKHYPIPSDTGAFHLILQLRDEAHRFAVTGHRQQRRRRVTHSPLEEITSVGPVRRRQLLRHFGGIGELKRASAEDIARVKGISRRLAEDIHLALQKY